MALIITHTLKVFSKKATFYRFPHSLNFLSSNLCSNLPKDFSQAPLQMFGQLTYNDKLTADTNYVTTTTSTSPSQDSPLYQITHSTPSRKPGSNSTITLLKSREKNLFSTVCLKNIFVTNCQTTPFVPVYYALHVLYPDKDRDHHNLHAEFFNFNYDFYSKYFYPTKKSLTLHITHYYYYFSCLAMFPRGSLAPPVPLRLYNSSLSL